MFSDTFACERSAKSLRVSQRQIAQPSPGHWCGNDGAATRRKASRVSTGWNTFATKNAFPSSAFQQPFNPRQRQPVPHVPRHRNHNTDGVCQPKNTTICECHN
jgi:hypothetical protein